MPFFGGGGGDYHIVGTNIKGGNQALPATIGTNNMGLGNGALQSALGADNNIAIGNLSLNAVTTGNNNISIGYDSFPVLAIGAYVVAVGGNTGAESTGSQESVIIGYGAFSSNFVQPHTANAAQQSVIIGTSAVPSGDVTSSVYIGAFARQGNAALSTNAVVIGANTLGLDSSVVIGAGASGDANSIAIGLNTVATANQIIIGDASYTSVQIGGITLASATGALFPSAIIGDPGTEGTGIVIGGVTYDSLFKVSDISSADIAQSIIHRHSTTWEPIQVFARSNSNGAGHGAVVNSLAISSQYSAGWTGTEYNLFSRIHTEAAPTGAISDASSPGDIVFSTTPDGSVSPAEAMRIKSDKSVTVNGNLSAGVIGTSVNNDTPDFTATNVVISATKTKGSTDASLFWVGNNGGSATVDLTINATPAKTSAFAVVPSIGLTADVSVVNGIYVHADISGDATPRTLSSLYGMFIQTPTMGANASVTTAYGILINPQHVAGDTITTAYGILIKGQVVAGDTTSWGLWSDSRCYAYSLTIGGDKKIYIGGSTSADGLIQQVGTKFNFYKGDSSGRLDIECGAIFSYANALRLTTAKTPASATDTGTAGDICWDANYIYVCVAANTWKRSALTTW